MALRKRIWRILLAHKGRYIGILILIFLGSFAFIAMRGVGENYARLVSSFAEGNLQEDLSFSTDRPLENIAALEQAYGAAIEPYRYRDVALPAGGELRLITPGHRVNLPAVTSGRGLQGPGEILTDPFFLTNHGLGVGDSVRLGSGDFEIVGTMALPQYIYPLKYINDILPPSGFGIGLISEGDMDSFSESVTVYSVRFADREGVSAGLIGLREALQSEDVSLADWTDAENNKRIRMAWATITGAQTMAVPLPVAMFLLCCLIVGIMIWRMVRADDVIIGTLYAEGYRRRELLRHYMAIPLLLAAAGGVLGVLLGLPTVAPMVEYMATSYYVIPYDGVIIAPQDILIGILMPVLFLGAASFLVIRRELRKSAAELMKGDREAAKINFLERHIRLERFPFRIKFQLREQLRSIPRLLFLLLGVTAASIMMLFGFTINHSMNTVFKGSSEDVFDYAYEYTFKEIRQDAAPGGMVPEGAVPFNAIRCYPEGRENAEFYLTGITADSEGIQLRDAQGNLLPKGQVNITVLLADRLKVKQGDSIAFINKLDGARYELAIDGIAQTYSGQFVYMPLEAFNSMTGQPAGSYSGVFSAGELPYADKELSGVKDLQNLPNAMEDIAMPMTMVVVFMTLIAAVMGAIIIFLVTSLMIEEGRGTISLLKVFGYRGREVSRLMLGSSTWVVLAGFVLAIPLMLLSAGAMYAYLGEMINMVLPMILSPVYVLVSFLLIMAVYQLTKRFCGRRLVKVPMSEALKAGAE